LRVGRRAKEEQRAGIKILGINLIKIGQEPVFRLCCQRHHFRVIQNRCAAIDLIERVGQQDLGFRTRLILWNDGGGNQIKCLARACDRQDVIITVDHVFGQVIAAIKPVFDGVAQFRRTGAGRVFVPKAGMFDHCLGDHGGRFVLWLADRHNKRRLTGFDPVKQGCQSRKRIGRQLIQARVKHGRRQSSMICGPPFAVPLFGRWVKSPDFTPMPKVQRNI